MQTNKKTIGLNSILEERYTITFKTWGKVSRMYEDKCMQQKIYDEALKIFCWNLKGSNASVMEIGCGPGNITAKLLKLKPDLRIFAIDVSQNMVDLAKKNNPNVRYEVMDCRLINKFDCTYDAVVCSFVIPYLTSQDCLELFLSIRRLLNDSGWLYLSFVAGNYVDSGRISDAYGNSMFFYYHEISSIYKDLAHCNLEIVHRMDKYVEQYGKKELHIILLIKRMGSN